MLRNRKLLASQKGMTLLEIVIVVTILAVLGAFLVNQVTKNLNKARYNETKLRMGNLARALDMYYTDCGNYPQSIDGLLQKDSCPNWGPEAYASKKDLLDAWNSTIEDTIQGNAYELRSFGSDKREGGEGFAADILYPESE
jgi:general secretion pathway protein G